MEALWKPPIGINQWNNNQFSPTFNHIKKWKKKEKYTDPYQALKMERLRDTYFEIFPKV